MAKDQKFGTCFLGGFKKKAVIKYINQLMIEHEQEVKRVKEEAVLLNKKLKEDLEKEQILSNGYKEEIVQLEKTVNEYNRNIDAVMSEKDNLIRLQSEKIEELEKKNEQLRDQDLDNLDYKDNEYQIKKAEYIAKEKVEQIIRKGKAKIEEEYNQKLLQWEDEKEKIKKAALKEASNILNNAASRVFNFNTKVQEESENILKTTKQKAKNILDAAKLVSDKMLKYSARVAFRQSVSNDLPSFKLFSKFDVKILNEQANEEVLIALEKLKDLNLFSEKEAEKDNIFKRYRKTALDGFMKRKKENRD